MKNGSRTLFLATTFLALGASAQALAQSKDYQPVGGRIGSFIAYPVFELQEEYNDNIYTEDSGTDDSFITRVIPSLVLQSDWNNHSLRLGIGAESGFYSHDSDDDYLDYQAMLDGRLDMTRATHFYVEDFGYAHLHEARGSDEVPGAAAEVWEYDRYGSKAGVRWKPNRLGVDLFGSHYLSDYSDLDLVGGGEISGSLRDKEETEFGAKVGYDFSPGYFGYVSGSYFITDFDQATSFGLDRDSDGYRIEAGLAFEASPLLTFDVAAGYVERDYDDPTTDKVDGVSLRGTGTWYATPLTTVGLSLYSDVDDTTSPTAAGKLIRGAELRVDHELLRNVVLDASMSYDNIDYQGGTLDREDNDFRVHLGATYWLNRNFFAGLSYDFTTRASDAAGQDYDQNVFFLRGGIQF